MLNQKNIDRLFRFLLVVTLITAFCTTFVFAADEDEILTDVVDTIKKFVVMGGIFLAGWGLVNLGTNASEQNGAGMQTAVWKIIGGAIVIAAGALFDKVIDKL